MFGLFKHKPKAQAEEYRDTSEELGVFTLVLTGVEDPFDPDPLWDRKYGGNPDITEERSGDRDYRLQAALDDCRNLTFVRDDAGRYREQTPVFTDVVAWLPGTKWRADAKQRGVRMEALASNLASLHKRKFARSLPDDRAPIYTVMPDDEIGANTVVFQFGFGVFVPQAEDELLGSIALKRRKVSEALFFPEWSFWHDGAQIKRPVGVYAGQGSLLITPDRSGPLRAPLWFGRRDGHIALNLSAADSERVYADRKEVQVAETVSPRREGEPFQWVLKDARGAEKEGEDTLVIELKFVSEPATRRAFSRKPKAPEPVASTAPAPPSPPTPVRGRTAESKTGRGAGREVVADDDTPTRMARARSRGGPEEEAPTRRPGAPAGGVPPSVKSTQTGLDRFFHKSPKFNTKGVAVEPPPADAADPGAEGAAALSTRYSLKITGCALLRIDGDRQLSGLEEWVMWFDRIGRPVRRVDQGAVDVAQALALAATAKSRDLFYRLPGERAFSPVRTIPCSLDAGAGRYLELVESPVPAAYHGLLLLRQEVTLPLSSQPLLLGRSDSAAEGAQPDLPIELLDHPDSLRWSGGKGPKGAKLNALNLSRRHVGVRLVGGKLEVAMAEGRMPVYVLDAEARLMTTMMPGDRMPQLIDPDELFVVGSYLLRFHQERTSVRQSRDVSVLKSQTRRPGVPGT
jgi:hypothetical protein